MSDDTRKDQRVKVQTLKAKYKSATIDEFVEQYAVDISRGGIFIKTPKPAPTGTLLKIEIQLRDASPAISAVGRVVWRRDAPEGGQPAGMGIKFIKIVDEASQALIDRIVAIKGEDAGPSFDSLPPPPPAETSGPVAGKTQSDFFGSTNPEAEMPAPQDRTMMRQMSAFLGEALRSTSGEGDAPAAAAAPPAAAPEPPPPAAKKPAPKGTIMGMPSPAAKPLTPATTAPADEKPAPTPAATVTPATPPPSAGRAAPPPASAGAAKKGTIMGIASPVAAKLEPLKPASFEENADQPTTVTNRAEIERLLSAPEVTGQEPEASVATAAVVPERTGATVDEKSSAESNPTEPEPTKAAEVEVMSEAVAAAAAASSLPKLTPEPKPNVPPATATEGRPIEPERKREPVKAPEPAAVKRPAGAAVSMRPVAAQEPPKSNTTLIAGVLLLLAAGAGGYFYLNRGGDHPSATGNGDANAAVDSGTAANSMADAGAAVAMADAGGAPVVATVDAAAPVVPPPAVVNVQLRGLQPGTVVFVDNVPTPMTANHVTVPAGRDVHVRAHAAGFSDDDRVVHAAGGAATLTFNLVRIPSAVPTTPPTVAHVPTVPHVTTTTHTTTTTSSEANPPVEHPPTPPVEHPTTAPVEHATPPPAEHPAAPEHPTAPVNPPPTEHPAEHPTPPANPGGSPEGAPANPY